MLADLFIFIAKMLFFDHVRKGWLLLGLGRRFFFIFIIRDYQITILNDYALIDERIISTKNNEFFGLILRFFRLFLSFFGLFFRFFECICWLLLKAGTILQKLVVMLIQIGWLWFIYVLINNLILINFFIDILFLSYLFLFVHIDLHNFWVVLFGSGKNSPGFEIL